ncbi:MAG: hypothetical protein WD059_15770 [Balneolaceae bacterium]
MNKYLLGAALLVMTMFSSHQTAKSQTIELLTGNALNGAVNGTLLGGATMAVTNNSDFAPLRIGLGLGTLYGIGLGAYDINNSRGHDLIVSGTFNDGNNTGIIVLLDTFYGAAAGAVIVSSVMLVANEPLIQGLQYGAGIGAWAGFGFGLIDVFTMAERKTSDVPTALKNSGQNKASGLVGINLDNSKSIGFISPSLMSTWQSKDSNFQQEITPTIEWVNLKLNF